MAIINRSTSFVIKDIIITPRAGKGISLMANLKDLVLYRSMENIVGSGYIVIIEDIDTNSASTSIRKTLGLYGMEGITIIMNSSGTEGGTEDLEFSYIIYAIDNVQILKDKRVSTIRFTEPFGIANSFLRIGKKYTNIKCSDAVDEVGKVANTSKYTERLREFYGSLPGGSAELFKLGYKDDSINNINFLVPMWHPLKTMLYFANSAVSEEFSSEKVADCVLFTNRHGIFSLLSLGRLFNPSSTKEFKYTFQNVKKGELQNSTQETRYNISQLTMSSLHNIQEFAKIGAFGKRLYEADLYTLAGSQNEKTLGIPSLQPAGNDGNLQKYPYKDFTFEEVKSATAKLYSKSQTLGFESWLGNHPEATPDHLYEIVYYNGANDKSENVIENIIEPKNLRGNCVKELLSYFKITIRIPLELELEVGNCFEVKMNDIGKIDEIASNKFVVSSVAHYINLTESFTMVEAFSIPSEVTGFDSVRQSTALENAKDAVQASLKK